jgi:serine/threonine protein kinase
MPGDTKAGDSPSATRPPQPDSTESPAAWPEVVGEDHHALNLFLQAGACSICPKNPRRYESREVVARGGMATIYRVVDPRLHRLVAMKVAPVTVDYGSGRPRVSHVSRLRRFLQEIQVHAQLDHPGVVPLYDVGLDGESRPFFTMRFVEGLSLEQVIRSVHAGGAELRSTLRAMIQACETMAYAHARGVVHRDLKPVNILIGHYGQVFVLDWGLAWVGPAEGKRHEPPGAIPGDLSDETSDRLVTPPGEVIGTPTFMPPEQAWGNPCTGPAADIYSLGAILYYLLSGSVPYGDVAPATSREILLALLRGPPRPIEELAPTAPVQLAETCRRAMSRKPRDRPTSALDVAEALRAYLEGDVARG